MQFGSSPRVCRFGYVLLFTVFGALTSSAQFGQFGQALSGQTGQQSCDPNDLTCQSSDQSNLQIRNPSSSQQQQISAPQIIVPGQQDTTQTNTQNNPQNQQQNQNQGTRLSLDSPTE